MNSDLLENERSYNSGSLNLEMAKNLKKLWKEIRHYRKFSDNSDKLFRRIAADLSNHLPKLSDHTLFDIDDLLYQDDDLTETIKSGVGMEKPDRRIKNKCIWFYILIYSIMTEVQPLIPSLSRTLDTALLQAISQLPSKRYRIIVNSSIWSVAYLMASRSTKRLCLSLKILKVLLDNNGEAVLEKWQIEERFSHFFIWLKRLPNIPHARLPQQRRITSWIWKQSADILKIMDPETKPFSYAECIKNYLDKYSSQNEDFDASYVHRRLYLRPLDISFVCDNLYAFFMSARDEEEKIKRLKDYILGIAYNPYDPEITYDHYEPVTFQMLKNFQEFRRIYFVNFNHQLRKCGYPDEVLRDMERRYGCQVEPYLSSDESSDYNFVAELEFQVKDEIINSSTNSEDEPDYTIERFLFYDDFVKKLQVLNIIHTASMMCQELFQTEGDFINCDGDLFRAYDNPVTRYLREVHLDISKRGHIPWIIEILIKKCPFMILPKRHEYLMKDLLKMLKGEQIDELAEEKLFLILNSSVEDYRWDLDLI